MDILTFDIEEWYLEKIRHGGRSVRYQQFDGIFDKVLADLNDAGIKATFFCVGQLATHFPEKIRLIVEHGHEVGCHSNEHRWLNKMTEEQLRKDTLEALKALEDVTGKKVVSYRAPAFSITRQNKWVVNVLSDCGIEIDASIFPTNRDFGGYKGFPQDKPCIISHEGATLKEYPISLTSVFGKQIAYSGGGYFRLMPHWFVNTTMKHRDYNICYFHLADLIQQGSKLMSKQAYEDYFKEPGTLKNRLNRYVKRNIRIGDTYEKFNAVLQDFDFISIRKSQELIRWDIVKRIEL
jgi:polysaccharide deacetylase family protein (PEP-CTERM system associated)